MSGLGRPFGCLGVALDIILESLDALGPHFGGLGRHLGPHFGGRGRHAGHLGVHIEIFDGFGVPFGVQFEVNLMTFSSFGVATAHHWFQVRFLMFWEWNSGRSSEELHGIYHAKHTVHILARIQFLSRIVVILGPVGEPWGPLEWLGVVLESGRNFDGFWEHQGSRQRPDWVVELVLLGPNVTMN